MSDKTRICSTCDKPKPDPDGFPKKGAQCKGCIADKAKKAYDAKNGKKTKTAKKAKSNGAPKSAAAPASSILRIDPCVGMIASISGDGFLEIGQVGENTDTVVLSRYEFRQLVEKFGAWAA